MKKLEVITSQAYWKRIRVYRYLAYPFALLAVFAGWDTVKSQGEAGLGMAAFMLFLGAFIAAVPSILVFSRRFAVQWFDEQGVLLRNGRRFLWTDFVKCEPRIHQKTKMLHSYDLVFKTGTASVYHQVAENGREVMDVIRALQAGTNPFVGGG